MHRMAYSSNRRRRRGSSRWTTTPWSQSVGDDAVIDSRGGSRRHTTTLTDWCRARDLEPTPQGGDADGDGEVWGGDGKEDEEVEEFTPAEIARQRAVTFVAARRSIPETTSG